MDPHPFAGALTRTRHPVRATSPRASSDHSFGAVRNPIHLRYPPRLPESTSAFGREQEDMNKLRTRLNQNEGFTLIELLVVIIIIGILLAIAIPSYRPRRRLPQVSRSWLFATRSIYDTHRVYQNRPLPLEGSKSI